MKLKFKIQQYQTDAVENVVRVFDGQPNLGLLEYKIDHGKVYVEQGGKRVEVKELEYDEEDTGYKNGDIVLDEETLLKNIHHIQTESNIHLSNDVVKKLGHCQLDVEMETYSATHKETHNPVYVLDALDAYNQKLVNAE
ncbi:MAG: hypothetical protein Q4D64_07460 [Prevotellaceae bacterium]|nr:hypothetical protein [Prevotellaceae bacterium]